MFPPLFIIRILCDPYSPKQFCCIVCSRNSSSRYVVMYWCEVLHSSLGCHVVVFPAPTKSQINVVKVVNCSRVAQTCIMSYQLSHNKGRIILIWVEALLLRCCPYCPHHWCMLSLFRPLTNCCVSWGFLKVSSNLIAHMMRLPLFRYRIDATVAPATAAPISQLPSRGSPLSPISCNHYNCVLCLVDLQMDSITTPWQS